MPSGVYVHKPHTKETRNKISATRIRKGIKPWHYGSNLSEDHKNKIRLANTGKKHSAITIEKMKAARKGKSAWWNIGSKRTMESRLKMSLRQLGIKKAPRSEQHRENLRKSNLGKKPSIQCVEALKKAMTGKKLPEDRLVKMREYCKGEKCYLWKGGVTPINLKIRQSGEYKFWRRQVFERDRFTCQWCGAHKTKIHADHIRPFSLFPTLRFEVSNGRTLCVPCHKKTESYCWGLRKKSLQLDLV